eukprot:gene993-588_t
MRRVCSMSLAGAFAARLSSTSAAKKYDLFGYEVDTNTAPWIEKIKQCKHYDDAGEILVDMNVQNCPPDLETYNATLQNIFESPSKQDQPVENESKFCAMMDLMEEMQHRNKVTPNMESWTWVLKECVSSGQFRLGFCVIQLMEAEFKSVPEDLKKANQENADRAKAEGNEHPGYLSQQENLLDIKIIAERLTFVKCRNSRTQETHIWAPPHRGTKEASSQTSYFPFLAKKQTNKNNNEKDKKKRDSDLTLHSISGLHGFLQRWGNISVRPPLFLSLLGAFCRHGRKGGDSMWNCPPNSNSPFISVLSLLLCGVSGFVLSVFSFIQILALYFHLHRIVTMRRVCSMSLAGAFAARLSSTSAAKKYDLFGYEVDTNTAPWIEKIKQCKHYDDAGEILVDMNVQNCPPDLETYNATLQNIFESPSKQDQPVENESKFCAMMDLMEEMQHRNKVTPNMESWTWVLKECVSSGQFRLGFCVIQLMEAEFKSVPEDLKKANQENADRAKAEGNEHPGHLSQQENLLDIKIV